jgi:hypothetical protein
MSIFDKFLGGAFFLIALYLVFNSENVSSILRSFGESSSNVFRTLQGR